MSPNSANRASWIDTARVLATYFVIQLHAQQGFASWAIPSMVMHGYVPFFFLFAGYFQSRHTNARQTFQRAWHLFIPYACWNACYFLLTERTNSGFFDFLVSITINPANDFAWFIRDLICLTLCTPLLARIKPAILMIILLNLGVFYFISSPIPRSFQGAYYAAGLLLGQFSIAQIKNVMNRHVCTNLAIGISLGFLAALWNYGKSIQESHVDSLLGRVIDIQLFTHLSHINFSFFGMAYGILIICQMSLFLEEKCPKFAHRLSLMAPACFVIYMGHYAFLIYLQQLEWFHRLWIIGPVSIFLLLYGLYFLIKRFFPNLLPFITNERPPATTQ